ncbi:MAG: hypothetical protein JW910_10890, partial [Anaerolineae bacterium]|nr:hypothetical protein [Anaerolineae bacterium]
AGLSITGEQRLVLVVNPTEWGTADGSLIPWFRDQFPGVLVREEQFASPAALTGWLLTHPDPFEE